MNPDLHARESRNQGSLAHSTDRRMEIDKNSAEKGRIRRADGSLLRQPKQAIAQVRRLRNERDG